MKLVARAVNPPWPGAGSAEVEQLRVIRNECREFMTRSTDFITADMQAKWWSWKSYLVEAFLFSLDDVTVGYGLMSGNPAGHPAGHGALSGGLLPDYRGLGHGKELFQHLISAAHKSGQGPWLEVRETNVPAHKLYTSLGFVETYRKDGIISMTRDFALPREWEQR